MKTERSDAKNSSGVSEKASEGRAEKSRSDDPDAFERVLKREQSHGDKTRRGDKSRKGRAPAGALSGDVGDEESWRGRVVEGEAQVESREARRGSTKNQRAEHAMTRETRIRERSRDEAVASDLRAIRIDERVKAESRSRTSDEPAPRLAAARSSEAPPEKAVPGRGGELEHAADLESAHRAVEGASASSSGTAKTTNEPQGRRAEVAEIARQIVESARSGFDEMGRKFLSMTMDVPGRGRLEIRLRKNGSKLQIELAAESPAFGRLLRRSRKDLKEQTRQRGVQVSSVRVTR